MLTDKEKALAELQEYQTEDQVLHGMLAAVWNIVEQSEIAVELDFDLMLGNLAQASPVLQNSHYATSNCMALLDEHFLIVDEGFLFEMEAAVRAFEVAEPLEGCPYVRSDEDLFRLTDRISADPYKALARMRKMTSHAPEKEQAISNTVTLTYLFFIGHELGHLLGGHEAANFTEFIEAGSPLEYQLANAVVKLRRHAEEFEEFGFDLPGFKPALTKGHEVERTSAELQKQIERLHLNHTTWFQNEVNADAIGTKIVLEHLSAVGSDDAANTCMYRIVRGVFAVALYSWYRDLRTFCRALGIGWLSNARSLTLAMCENREHYINAASLFGNVHRFTLLRAERLIRDVISARSNVFDGGQGEAHLFGSNNLKDAFKLREAVSRYYLLCIMMDTAVKISYLGASTAWILEADLRRGTEQVLLMNFEPVDRAMRRLKDLIG
jgi:hypothetical protein